VKIGTYLAKLWRFNFISKLFSIWRPSPSWVNSDDCYMHYPRRWRLFRFKFLYLSHFFLSVCA